MIWGAVSMETRSPLVIMKRELGREGYTNWSYREALMEGLLPIWPVEGGLFQQDNARIHTAQATKEWLKEHGINLIPWPTHSPDLNPIEHVWKAVKTELRRLYPDMHLLKDNEAHLQRFCSAIKEAWEKVAQVAIRNLINSIERRLRAVIRAHGWYTKY